MRKHNGSIFSFLAVALVLVIATGLVVFAINNRSSSGDGVVEDVISQVDSDNEDNGEDSSQGEESRADDEQERSDESTNSTSEEESTTETSQDDENSTESDSSEPAGPTVPSSSPSTPSSPSTGQDVSTTELPETGLTNDLLSSAIGLLAIVGAGYVYYHFGRK